MNESQETSKEIRGSNSQMDLESILADAERGESSARTLDRQFQVFKHYRKSQILARLKKLALRRLRFPIQGVVSDELVSRRSLEPFARLWDARRKCQFQPKTTEASLLAGRFTLLNETMELGHPIDWRAGGSATPHLWRFQLHYFEYLYAICAGDESTDAAWQVVGDTILDWVGKNRNTDRACYDDAWHPYCISRRLPVWFQLLAANSFDQNTRDAIVASCFAQAIFLSKNLEWDLRGNHLLENLRCLTLAGCFFDDERAGNWLARVLPILRRELDEQVLASGEHFERCPMYHCQVLTNLMEMTIVVEDINREIASLCRSHAETMFAFLQEVLHPDQEIPLFGDSCFEEAPSVELVRTIGEELGFESKSMAMGVTEPGDYWIYRHDDSALIFDRGPVGPDHLPAHAHCDLLTIEASIGGNRWIVDSGIYNYQDDSMRAYTRSSAAHNVVTVAGINQCDVWSKFRMGRRGYPQQVDQGTAENFEWATGSHNGYARLGFELRRMIVCQQALWICFDRVVGNGSTNLIGFLHLAPEMNIDQLGQFEFRLTLKDESRILTFCNADRVKLVNSWYCPEFGKRLKNKAFVYEVDKRQNSGLGWWMASVDERAIDVFLKDDDSMLEIITNNQRHTIDWK